MSRGLNLYFIADPKVVPDNFGALAEETSFIKDAILIRNIEDLIHRVTAICIARRNLVSAMVISSHGNQWNFFIGENRMYAGDPRLQKLSVLRPFFLPNAILEVSACECGQAQELLQQVAGVLGVTVVGYTGSVRPNPWGHGIIREGNKVICTASGCREVDRWEELKTTIQRGPGERPGWAREM